MECRRHRAVLFWKRDEAVVLVREGSIVVGASRYEPRLRCIISLRVHIIDAAVHLRSRSTPYPTRIRSLRRRPFPRRKRRRVGGASVLLFIGRIWISRWHHNNIVQMRLRCVAVAPPTCNHTLHHTGRTAPLSTLSLSIKFIFGALQPQPLLEVIHIHPRGSARPHHGDPCVVPRELGAHAASVVPA